MIRLFDTEDENPQEYNGMKVGDVICTYNAGFHVLDKIIRRFYTQEHIDTYFTKEINNINAGDEYTPNFQYTKFDADTGKVGQRKGGCDSYYCHSAIVSLEEQISRLQKQRNRIREYNSK